MAKEKKKKQLNPDQAFAPSGYRVVGGNKGTAYVDGFWPEGKIMQMAMKNEPET